MDRIILHLNKKYSLRSIAFIIGKSKNFVHCRILANRLPSGLFNEDGIRKTQIRFLENRENKPRRPYTRKTSVKSQIKCFEKFFEYIKTNRIPVRKK